MCGNRSMWARGAVAVVAAAWLPVLAAAGGDADPASSEAGSAGAVTLRVSVGPSGAQANRHSSGPSISADGRYVAFTSAASNLVAGDTNDRWDVFVRDRVSHVTRLMSVGPGGARADRKSTDPAISADGRYVAFTSRASNLVAGDTNDHLDVFVRDRVAHVTRRVSVGAGSAQANGKSFTPGISADGRYVAFTSQASNLVAGDTNDHQDVFVRDRVAHVTRLVSVSAGGDRPNANSFWPSISEDGRYVAFSSRASNLVAGDTNNHPDVFVRDRMAQVTERVSVGPGGRQADQSDLGGLAISADGRYVVFESEASNLVAGDTNDHWDVFVRDRVARVTRRVSVSSGGAQTNRDSYTSSISADGRYVAFLSQASNLVAGDTNDHWDVFVRDRVARVTRRVSVSSGGAQANSDSYSTSISADGRYVAFDSWASNLVPRDTNHDVDVFVRVRAR